MEKTAAALSRSSRSAANKRTVRFAGGPEESVRRAPGQPAVAAAEAAEVATGAAVRPAVEPKDADYAELPQPLFKSRAWMKARNEAVSALVERRGLSGREKVAIVRQIQRTLDFLTTPLGMGLGQKSPVGGKPTPSSVCWRFAKTLAGQRRHRQKHHKKPQRPHRQATPQAGWEPGMIRLETQKIEHEIVAFRDQHELERDFAHLETIEKGRVTQAKWEGVVRRYEAGGAQTREARLASLASTPLYPIPPSLISERLLIPQLQQQEQKLQQQKQMRQQQEQKLQQLEQEQKLQKQQQQQQQQQPPELATWSPFHQMPTEPGRPGWPNSSIFPSPAAVGEQRESGPSVVEVPTAVGSPGAAASAAPIAPPPAPKVGFASTTVDRKRKGKGIRSICEGCLLRERRRILPPLQQAHGRRSRSPPPPSSPPPRRAPSPYCEDAKVCGHSATVIHGMITPPLVLHMQVRLTSDS